MVEMGELEGLASWLGQVKEGLHCDIAMARVNQESPEYLAETQNQCDAVALAFRIAEAIKANPAGFREFYRQAMKQEL